jgi:hypothetical protein
VRFQEVTGWRVEYGVRVVTVGELLAVLLVLLVLLRTLLVLVVLVALAVPVEPLGLIFASTPTCIRVSVREEGSSRAWTKRRS